jgi:hypothetical protein
LATPADTVRSFYSAIAAGNVETSMSLMANDVEWVTVEVWSPSEDNDELTQLSAFIAQTLADRYGGGWAFKFGGRGPQEVAQHGRRIGVCCRYCGRSGSDATNRIHTRKRATSNLKRREEAA